MHSFNTLNTNIVFEGDYSGDVIITDREGHTAVVPFEDIKDFVATYVINRRIEVLEKSDSDQIFGLVD